MDYELYDDDSNIGKEFEFTDMDALNKYLNTKDLIILHINVRGLNANHSNLEIFIEIENETGYYCLFRNMETDKL